MRRLYFCCLLFAGPGLFGQTTPADQAAAKLDSILSAMKKPGASRDSLSQQLANVMLSLAQRDHQPSRSTVMAFTDELTEALIGKDLKNAPPKWLLESTLEILSISGANYTKAIHLQNALNSIGVDRAKAQRVITRFIRIGEELKGPDDLGVK